MILDYCHQLFDVLKKLEELLNRADELKQDYERRVTQQIEWQAIFLGIFISSILIAWFMTGKSGMFGRLAAETGATEVFLRMFSISFIALVLGNGIRIGSQWLWMRNYLPIGKKMIRRFFLKKYLKKEGEIAQNLSQVLMAKILEEPQLPEKYLNTRSLNYIIDCLEGEEVNNLSEAINLLELESRDIQVHDLITVEESTVLRARQLVSDSLVIK
ncbi:hypothetical protein [Lactococcus protaetiae]|uniref:Uncharacterized protein n=1 Tax=Lactococcus protaetiae TaxID=2592653 RepID=A0A514ZAX8_9LACT|nr:hypothetical protein [Lactococcus protaetiae]QDK71729.1 hypothetical protein FLP15_11805 [Lactococcus protaetiae]